MSIASSEPDTTTALNPYFASAATSVAQFLIDHTGPDIGSIALDRLGSSDLPRVLLHVGQQRLSALVEWAQLVQEPTIGITRRATYIAATVTTTTDDDTQFILWTHLATHEIATVWKVLDPAPEMGETTHVAVEALQESDHQ